MGKPRDPVKRWPPPPTLEDVARAANVSRALVSLVVRGSPTVSEVRRARIEAAIAELGYRPNAMARSLAARGTATVGILIHDLHNPFFADIVEGVEEAADKAGYRTLLSAGEGDRRREGARLETFLQHRVDGLLLLSSGLRARDLATIEVPMASVGRRIPGALDSVITGDLSGMRLAVRHLVEFGHRLIVYIDSGRQPGGPQRRRGYLAAMESFGLAPTVVRGDFTEAGGAQAARTILTLSPRPTAVMSPNDLAAAGALDVFESASLRVPDDLSLTGYDDTYIAGLLRLGLTSVAQPRRELGRVAFTMLHERMQGRRTRARHCVLQAALVVRRSTGPVCTRQRKGRSVVDG